MCVFWYIHEDLTALCFFPGPYLFGFTTILRKCYSEGLKSPLTHKLGTFNLANTTTYIAYCSHTAENTII